MPDVTEFEALSYEQARDELVKVVSQLEAGGIPLEEALELWKRGEALAAVCQKVLDDATAAFDAVEQASADSANE